MTTVVISSSYHVPFRFIRQVDVKHPVNGIATSALGVSQLNLASFSACAGSRLPNRLLCASAGSVCVTWLPALISPQSRYA